MNIELAPQTQAVIHNLACGGEIAPALASTAFLQVLNLEDEEVMNVLLGSFLTGFLIRDSDENVIVEMLKTVAKFDDYNYIPHYKIKLACNKPVISITGSGKKQVKTINVSTCATFVAAALGAYVLKAGSFATSSKAGSADFFQKIGVNVLEFKPEMVAQLINRTHVGFYNIELSVPKFNQIYGGKLYSINALSLGLAPMLNPFVCDKYIYGLASSEIRKSNKILSMLGRKNTTVYCCKLAPSMYLDEISPIGCTYLYSQGKADVFLPSHIKDIVDRNYTVKDFNNSIRETPDTVYEGIKVLMGKGHPFLEDLVALNAALIVKEADIVESFAAGYEKAKDVISSGAPYQMLERFVLEATGSIRTLADYLVYGECNESIFRS